MHLKSPGMAEMSTRDFFCGYEKETEIPGVYIKSMLKTTRRDHK